MYWVMFIQSCLTFMLHTQACFPYYAGLSTIKQLPFFNTLQNVCQYYLYNKSYSTGIPKWYHIWDNRIVMTSTIVFSTINNIKGNWQCIGTYISYMIMFFFVIVCYKQFNCVDGTYGQDCSQDCSNNCYDNTCHVVSGLCLFGCRKGWMGTYCKQRKLTSPIMYTI
jgi:hypothetical protein